LLFAGTRSTAYVSLNGGASWQPLTLNLPGVQVRDLAVDSREGELVAATHGRAFWILDGLALLEQLARRTSYSVANAQLFDPEAAWLTHAYGSGAFETDNTGENPEYGATIFFNLPPGYNGRTPATLTFYDASGSVVRAFPLHLKPKNEKELTPDQEANLDAAQQRAHQLAELTAVQPGMNAFQWDLRYAPGYDFPGFRAQYTDDFLDTSDGPTVLPGKYDAVLQYGAQKLEVPLTVQLDPRLHPAPGDLQARFTLESQILATIDRLDRTISAAMTAASKMAPAQRTQIDAAIAELVQLDIHSSEADVLHPTKIREQLAFLMNSLEGAYTRPTAAEYATYSDLKALADAGEAKLKALSTP